jgi:hypothetical protein
MFGQLGAVALFGSFQWELPSQESVGSFQWAQDELGLSFLT